MFYDLDPSRIGEESLSILESHMTFKIDSEITVIAVSESIKELLGFNADDFLTDKVSLSSRFHADDQYLCPLLFALPASSETGSFTVRIRQSNDNIRIIRLDYKKTIAADAVLLNLFLRDVKSLYHNSEPPPIGNNLDAMMANTNDYIYFKDKNHVFTAASQTLVALCSPVNHWTDFLGLTDYDVFPEEYADIYFTLERKIFNDIPIAQEVQKILSVDGQEGWVDNRKYPIKDDDGNIIGLFGVARDITKLKRAEHQTWHQANFDRLTNLPNRALFFDRLAMELSKSRRYDTSTAILFLDLDGFKAVNDVYGHEAGDEVLIAVAQRWQSCIRDTDTLARIGGDEFTIILSNLEKLSAISEITGKLINALSSEIILLSKKKCQVGVSIGISIYPQNATEMDTLLSAADAAMYKSKVKGKNTFSFSIASPSVNHQEWINIDADFIVGIDEIDSQHQHLAGLVNQINHAVANRHEREQINHLFEDLINYTVFHFETEHQLMVDSDYPEIKSHNRAHKHLLNQLQYLADQKGEGNEMLLLQTVKDWLFNHVRYCDKALGNFLKAHNKP